MSISLSGYTGIKIGEIHTLDDWGLLLLSVEIPYPDPKTKTVELLGGDGVIDLTDAMGGVKFSNRTLSFGFVLLDKNPRLWTEMVSKMRNYCHGKKMQIVMDTDPSHYWEGRCYVNSTKEDQIHSTVTVRVDAFPYKYDVLSSNDPWLWDPFSFVSGVIRTIDDITLTGADIKIMIPAGNMPIVPIFYVSNIGQNISVSYKSREFELEEGANRIPQIIIGVEETELIFSGKGTVRVSYRGGSL